MKFFYFLIVLLGIILPIKAIDVVPNPSYPGSLGDISNRFTTVYTTNANFVGSTASGTLNVSGLSTLAGTYVGTLSVAGGLAVDASRNMIANSLTMSSITSTINSPGTNYLGTVISTNLYGTFTGNGAGLTNVNPSTLSSFSGIYDGAVNAYSANKFTNVLAFGDSITRGFGGLLPWTWYFMQDTGIPVNGIAVDGLLTDSIMSNAIAYFATNPGAASLPVSYEGGANDAWFLSNRLTQVVISNWTRCISSNLAAGNSNYVVWTILNWTNAGPGTSVYSEITNCNATLFSTFGANHVFDFRAWMMAVDRALYPEDYQFFTNDCPGPGVMFDLRHPTNYLMVAKGLEASAWMGRNFVKPFGLTESRFGTNAFWSGTNLVFGGPSWFAGIVQTSTNKVGLGGAVSPTALVNVVTPIAGGVGENLRLQNPASTTGTGVKLSATLTSADFESASLTWVRQSDSNPDFSVNLYNGSTSKQVIYAKGTTGNVGIGTNAPAAKLHVVGDAIVSSNLSVGGTISGNNLSISNSTTIDSLNGTTNTFAGPSAVFYFTNGVYQYYTAAANCTILGFTNQSGINAMGSLWISNSSASSINVTISAPNTIYFGNSTNLLTVPGGGTWIGSFWNRSGIQTVVANGLAQ